MASQCSCVEAARKGEIALPPPTKPFGDAIPVGNNDEHGSEGYDQFLAF